MPPLAAVLTQTPLYVWALLGWIAWQGVAALRPRTQKMWRIFVVPAIFIAAGVVAPFLRTGGLIPLAAWGIGVVLLLPVGFRTGPRLLAVDHAAGTVTRPGTPWTLVRNVLAFIVQYVLAVAAAVTTDDRAMILLAARGVSGAMAGYFLGWAASAWLQYRAAPMPDAPPATPGA